MNTCKKEFTDEIRDMKNLWSFLLQVITKQGLSFVLLAAMAFYFQNQTEALQDKTDQCNERIIEMYKEQSEENRKVIRENTEAIRNFSLYLREERK